MRMTWLADVLRDAGLQVAEVAGWRTRGRDGMRPKVVIGHHTATPLSWQDSSVTNLLVQGRSDLAGPLAHLGLNRRGVYFVIAAGKANHAGVGRWQDADESVEAIGIEAYNWGNSVPFPSREDWPVAQMEAFDRGVAALLDRLGRPAQYFCGHREWALPPGRKPDPSGIDLGAMRARIHGLMSEEAMTLLQARLEVAAEWHRAYGEWMTPVGTETRQARLSRLADAVFRKQRTLAEIIRAASTTTVPVQPPPNEDLPSWVLDPSIPHP